MASAIGLSRGHLAEELAINHGAALAGTPGARVLTQPNDGLDPVSAATHDSRILNETERPVLGEGQHQVRYVLSASQG
jgi:hypothetical protein